MTNGEKMQADFPDIEMWGESKDTLDYSLGGMVHRVTKKWWNAEYKEPSNSTSSDTKNETLVSLDVYKQVAKERDIAIEQLHELGYEFGQKIEPTTKNDLSSGLEKNLKKLEKDFCESDCVSRQAVLEQAYAYGNGLEPDGYCVNVEDIQALPSVTPIRPKGHWIEHRDDYGEITHWHCSNCYDDSGFITTCKWDYCPNCGSDNREVVEE